MLHRRAGTQISLNISRFASEEFTCCLAYHCGIEKYYKIQTKGRKTAALLFVNLAYLVDL
jgi:hypothetical protein